MSLKHLAAAILLFTISFASLFFGKDRYANNDISRTDSFPLLSKIKEFKGKTVISKEGIIQFSSGLHNDFYHLDSLNRIGYLYVQINVGQFFNKNNKRLPLNISLVLDRSGSMKGDKMKFAKEAAKEIIENLTGDDFVSIVMYDHEVTLIQPATKLISKDSIYKKIDAIEERGSTNLWGGSERGYEQVKKNYHPNYINRVLLISDGLANSGLTNSRVICNKVQQWKDGAGITLSTFGVGLDYNEVLMTDMAENGAGSYYFINDLNKMSSILEKELLGLNFIAAQNAQLEITLPPGMQLVRVYAIKPVIKANVVSIQFRDLFSNETKGALLHFRLNNGSNADLKFSSLLNYTDLADNKQKQIANENILSAIRETDAYLTHFNRQVLEQTVLYKSNEALEKAMLEVDRGLFEGARLLLNKNQLYLKEHGALVQSSLELQKMQQAIGHYLKKLDGAEQMSGDSLKLIQKVNRQESYKIRNKRQ